ncbi:MAG: hypothetical protein AAGE01_11485 [Pseudomonadota bacterium]
MTDRTSRYANAPKAELTAPDGSVVRYLVPTLLPHPDEVQVAQRHRITDTDRLDTIAARAYGQATAWWLIANANTPAHPDQLTDPPGSLRVIPMPDPGGGAVR